jgi:hypothetical protein
VPTETRGGRGGVSPNTLAYLFHSHTHKEGERGVTRSRCRHNRTMQQADEGVRTGTDSIRSPICCRSASESLQQLNVRRDCCSNCSVVGSSNKAGCSRLAAASASTASTANTSTSSTSSTSSV